MFWRIVWAFFALEYVSGPSGAAAQDNGYQFTSGVASPAPIPGQPFTLTWTGGESTGTVYIILNYLFPDTPSQNIPYITTDILSNAPNTGTWTYNVPLNIEAGRYTFSIGVNPFLLSDTTDIFTVLSSQTSDGSLASGPASSTSDIAPLQSYNGCGLPPLADYTYSGYQAPCTVTTDGHVETLYPIVPASDSSAFFGNGPFVSTAATSTGVVNTSPTSGTPTSPPPVNTAFAPGVYAQALQCPTPVMPTTTKITASGITTVFTSVGCSNASGPTNSDGNNSGVCHSTSYITYSVSGTSSVCCPTGWTTTLLNPGLFCFTSVEQGVTKRAVVAQWDDPTETLVTRLGPLVTVSGLAITSAGVVKNEAAVTTSGSGSPVTTSSAAGVGVIRSGCRNLRSSSWLTQLVMVTTGVLYHLH